MISAIVYEVSRGVLLKLIKLVKNLSVLGQARK